MRTEHDELVIRRFGIAVVVAFGMATALPFGLAATMADKHRPAADAAAAAELAKSAQSVPSPRGD
jgi:hypothetical protein